jgi:hypothetical protein
LQCEALYLKRFGFLSTDVKMAKSAARLKIRDRFDVARVSAELSETKITNIPAQADQGEAAAGIGTSQRNAGQICAF